MSVRCKFLLLLLPLFFLMRFGLFAAPFTISNKVQGLMENYCFDCHDKDSKNEDGSYKMHLDWKNKQTISAPLIGWTKKQQWNYLRDDLKDLVQSCVHYNNCGKCIKCEEFNLMINS